MAGDASVLDDRCLNGLRETPKRSAYLVVLLLVVKDEGYAIAIANDPTALVSFR